MEAISARNLSKTYWYHQKEAGFSGSIRALLRAKKVSVEAVRDIDLNVEVGEVVGFVGPNGAGKTTTLKMLSGILHPTSGSIAVMGFSPFKREQDFLKSISFVMGQRSRLFWDLPAEEYFNFCRVVYEIPDAVFQRNRRRLVELAEIGDILKVPQRKLSFGQRKRCELAAALLHDPAVIFLDEPTNALDLVNARKIRDFIKQEGKEGKHTIMLTSHILSDIEQTCERILVINQGRIAYDGSIRNLIRMDGFKKRIRVVFGGDWSQSQLDGVGAVKEIQGQEVLLEVNPAETQAVISYLAALGAVKDINIADQPLEQVVEALYVRQESEDKESGDRSLPPSSRTSFGQVQRSSDCGD
jgi:ABC-2 type transport system ATP-binding protein